MRKDILLGTILLITGALTPGCSEVLEVLGCRDETAENYDANANADKVDQYGNSLCIYEVYESCDVVPEYGFSCYVDGLGAFAQLFGSCVDDYGGTWCGQEPNPSSASVVASLVDILHHNSADNIDLSDVVANIDLSDVVEAEVGETQAPSEVGETQWFPPLGPPAGGIFDGDEDLTADLISSMPPAALIDAALMDASLVGLQVFTAEENEQVLTAGDTAEEMLQTVNQVFTAEENEQVLTAGGIDDTAEEMATLVSDLASNSVSVSDCTGLKVAFQANCHCGVEYTHSGSLGPVVDKSDCFGLKKAYKDCDCSQ